MQIVSNRVRNIIGIAAAALLVAGGYFLITRIKTKAGLSYDAATVKMDDTTYPAVVIGGGIGGMTAGVYLAMANIKTALFEGDSPGGLLNQSLSVRNWPGEIESPGAAITEKLRAQALKRGVQVEREKVIGVDVSSWPYQLTVARVDDPSRTRTVKALSLIVGMGALSNYLDIPGEKEYWSKGVTNCAVCEGSLYRGKTICVVGGGDSAMEEASYLSGLAKKVYVFVRRDKLRAVDNRKDEVIARDNVEVVYNTSLREIRGDRDKVTSVVLHNNKDNRDKEVPMDGVFLAIGFTPNTQLFVDELTLTKGGYIKLYNDQETSVRGVYGIGDIVDPVYKQAVTAAGDGCRAALQAQRFLGDCGYDPNKKVATEVKGAAPAPVETPKEVAKEDPAPAEKEDFPALSGDPGKNENFPAGPPLKAGDAEEPAKAVAAEGSSLPQAGVPHEITSAEELSALTMQTKQPVVVDFYATWCMPCKQMAPLYKKLAKKYDDKVTFLKVNIDKVPEVSAPHAIRGVPTFTFIKEGTECGRIVGATTQGQFTTQIDKLL